VADPPARGTHATPSWLPQRLVAATGGARAVLVDGEFRPELSTATQVAELSIRALGQALPGEQVALRARVAGAMERASSALPALNAALLRDGLVIDIADAAAIEAPIYLAVATGTAGAAHNRILVRLGAGARATLIEHHLSDGESVSNSVTDVVCGPGAQLRYLKLQDEAETAAHIATQQFTLEPAARAELLHLDLGAGLARNDLMIRLAGRGAAVHAHGFFHADGERHLDNHTRVDHCAPETLSRELYRGIADGRGRGVFNGKVIVHKGAAGTDARLSNQNLLLSSAAEIDTKPELEIYADDVKCSHGATTGQLDATAIFYLRSRGIDAAEARRMLIASFACEILQHAPAGTIGAHVLALLERKLPEIGEVSRQP
jgi:Fe-S cluster assembly protein SufD